MERTTNPSVLVLPSEAAIAAAITATSSPSSVTSSTTGSATGTATGAGAAATGAGALSFFFPSTSPGIYLKREITKIRNTRITNTVPRPITVFMAAFSMFCASV